MVTISVASKAICFEKFSLGYLFKRQTLQGKYPLAEVIKEVFSVIKLAKIVKKTYATTSVFYNRCFGGAFNRDSKQLKNNGRLEVITDVFSSVLLSSFNAPVCIGRQRTGVVEGECTRPLRKTLAPGLVLVIQCMGLF